MDNEERLHELERIALEQSAELMAMDILLKSLIVSHPDRDSLKLSIEVLAARLEDQAQEHGFESGRKPETIRNMASSINSHIYRWLKLFPENGPGS